MSESAFSRTDAAIHRLGAAIDRLESAAARVGAGDLLLAGELRDAREQQAALADANRVVSARLDQAIFRLRTLIEE